MKLSETKTDYLIFKAVAFDEWTMINCAIVKINHIANALLNADIAVNLMKPVKDFWNMSFWNGAPDFFFIDSDEHEWIDELDGDKIWSFADITEEELATLMEQREIRTESGMLTINASKQLRFVAYVKHTNIEMATEHFTLAQLGVETGD